MGGADPWETLTDERYHKQNANLDASYTFYLMQWDTIMEQLVDWCEALGLDPHDELRPLMQASHTLTQYTRAEGHLGSDQLVSMAVGGARFREHEYEAGRSPLLTPAGRNGDSTRMKVVDSMADDAERALKKSWLPWKGKK